MTISTHTPDPIRDCFYARWFTREEKRYLKKSSLDGSDEVNNLRIQAGRLTEHLSRKQVSEYSDDDLKLLTSLVRISAGIGALQRGNATIQKGEDSAGRALGEAVLEANRLEGLDEFI
jgi:hypothetical protein